MAKSSAEHTPPHEFPFWPFSCMAFYSHALRDFGRYSQAMTHATDAMQTVSAESNLGLDLWRDAMQAYYDLAVLPMTLAAKAAAAGQTGAARAQDRSSAAAE